MKLTVDINYDQIVKLVKQLPRKDVKKLIEKLQSEINRNKKDVSLRELILNAPTWTDENWSDYKESRDFINKSRIA